MISRFTPFLFLFLFTGHLVAQDEMIHLASYHTDGEGSAETVDYDATTGRAFFTSTTHNSLSIVDISDPTNPTLYKEIPLAEYGAGPNSVAVRNGVVVVAVENEDKTQDGKVVFFNPDGDFISEVTVGLFLTWSPSHPTA